MAKTKEVYQNKMNSFKDRIQKETPEIPMQKVVPTGISKHMSEPQEQLGLRLPKSLIKKVKLFALQKETSVKDITVQALNAFLEENN